MSLRAEEVYGALSSKIKKEQVDPQNYYTKQQVDGKFADVENKEDEKIRTDVANAIAEVVADAPESFDTLKEIADWIEEHPEDTAAMNSQIQENSDRIQENSERIEAAEEGIASLSDDLGSYKEEIAEANFLPADSFNDFVDYFYNEPYVADGEYVHTDNNYDNDARKMVESIPGLSESFNNAVDLLNWLCSHSLLPSITGEGMVEHPNGILPSDYRDVNGHGGEFLRMGRWRGSGS